MYRNDLYIEIAKEVEYLVIEIREPGFKRELDSKFQITIVGGTVLLDGTEIAQELAMSSGFYVNSPVLDLLTEKEVSYIVSIVTRAKAWAKAEIRKPSEEAVASAKKLQDFLA